jgi:hypothetical protein
MFGRDQLRLRWRAVEEAICGAADILTVRPSIALMQGMQGAAAGRRERTKLGTMAPAGASGGASSFNLEVFIVAQDLAPHVERSRRQPSAGAAQADLDA